MGKIFTGKHLSYNLDEFKRQLDCQGVSLDSYECDDVFYFLNLVDKYNLELSCLDIEVIDDDDETSTVHINGECGTQTAIRVHDHLVDMLIAIKFNLNLCNYTAKADSQDIILNNLDDMLNYIKNNMILIQCPVQEDNSRFHALYLEYSGIFKPVIFVNTNEYLHNQYYYLAYELYYHLYDNDDVKANEFATKLIETEDFNDTKTNIYHTSDFILDILIDNFQNGRITLGQFEYYKYLLYDVNCLYPVYDEF